MKNKELELGLMNSIIQRPAVLDDMAEGLHEELFTDRFARDLYNISIQDYNSEGKVSRSKIMMFVRDKYPARADELLSSVYAMPGEVEKMADELKNYYNQRILHKTYKESYKYVQDHDLGVNKRNSNVQDAIMAVTNQFLDEGKMIYNAEEVAISCLKNLHERQEGKTQERLRTGMKDLDGFLAGGFKRQNLSVLAGGTSMGKTAFALNVVRNILSATDHPVFFVSMEMAKEELMDRLLVQKAKVNADDYNAINEDNKNPLPDNMRESIEVARNWVHNKDFLITDQRGIEVRNIKTLCRQAHNKFENGLGFVVIDYLSEINLDDGGNKNTAKIFGDAVRELRNMSKELNCHVLLLHQISREYQKRQNNRPKKSDLRDSGEIEEKADVVMFVHRPAYFKFQQSEEDEPVVQKDAEIIVAKQRGGKVGSLKFVWYPEIQYFQSGVDFGINGEINYLSKKIRKAGG
ncbi:replicative DNA helicase [Halarsenatibacter silvermanii]|uniref:Replicative DNA helicase n=1 Tax=Halarsenatibacter silvermanii TaxID=321763 RepID=A0A1G9R8R9_9FIRM|nr:DnaB-like helicase C-terminal domain-containing protein [Halarsenatibacter silvermanii]SDM19702.1 replicative DNA helicase [Halarsenatibacter silvermanii]